MSATPPLRLNPEVADALDQDAPVVALETTLVSHGFPLGRGAEVALEAESVIRAGGAIPATVGLIDGEIRVGLDPTELEMFSARPETRKVGARDLASCLVSGEPGATTVGATLAVCELVGLRVFATGGLGGIHRGYAERPDISSDLMQLAHTRTLVVSSGVKSLLDVAATHEALESLAVPVLGWRTGSLPLFYSRDGGPPVERIDTVEQVASLSAAHWSLRGQALLLTRPPEPEIPTGEMTRLFDAALAEAKREGVMGGAVTPFVLAYAHEASDGLTLDVNHRLIVDNAALAAATSVALANTKVRKGPA